MKGYSLGFLFRPKVHFNGVRRHQVLLLRKKKPEWMYNLLTGVGGAIEAGETPVQAMVREFQEETGLETLTNQWVQFATLDVMGSRIHVFKSFQPTKEPKTMTDEEVGWYRAEHSFNRGDMYRNTHWLMSMALQDPHFTHEITIHKEVLPHVES